VYVTDSQVDATCLRQGDILDAAPFPIIDGEAAVLGRVESSTRIQLPHPSIVTIPREHRKKSDCVTMQIKARFSPCVILDHCCELEIRNGKCSLLSLCAARIVPVKESTLRDAEKFASLRANKDPRNPDDPGYLGYFYLEPHPSLGGMSGIVDFAQTASIPGGEYEALLHRRVLQLSDRERVKFKIKLAVFHGRLTDEEVTAGLENPWLAERASAATEGT